MNILERAAQIEKEEATVLQIWQEKIGDLPAGFCLGRDGCCLFLFYKGEGWERLTNWRSVRQRPGENEALACWGIAGAIKERDEEIISGVKKKIGKVLGQLAKPEAKQ